MAKEKSKKKQNANTVGATSSRPHFEGIAKEKKGITLIALIITIIVMIILVAVTVNVAIQGRLFGTADTASKETEMEAIYDQIVGAMKLNSNGNVNVGETYSAAKRVLESQGKTVGALQEDGTFEVIGIRGTYTYKITEEKIIKGEVTGEGTGGSDVTNPPVVTPPEEGKLLESKYTQTIGTRKIVVPEGFGVVDTTTNKLLKEENYETYIAANLDNGIVVKDGTGNEFVWIPVPEINDMVMCQSAGTNGTCTITLEGEILKCTKHNSEALVGRLYATTSGENFNANLTGQKYYTNAFQTSVSDLREPAVLSSYDTQAKFTEYGGGTYSDTMYQTEFNLMATSVVKNGGFYVGRYETGGFNETKVVSKPDRGMDSAGGDINNTYWYKMYQMQKDFGNDIVGSSMIWGCQYDQVMKFVNGKNNFSVTTPNASRHSGSSTTGTGNTPADFVANIYDLEGNMYEWTLEANDTDYRVYRAGDYLGSYSASYRYSYYPSYSSNFSSRVSTHSLCPIKKLLDISSSES